MEKRKKMEYEKAEKSEWRLGDMHDVERGENRREEE